MMSSHKISKSIINDHMLVFLKMASVLTGADKLQRVSPLFNPSNTVGTCFSRFVFQTYETIVTKIFQ